VSRGDVKLRELRASDRPALESLIRATGVFSEEEVGVALELIDIGIQNPSSGYLFFVAAGERDVAIGYACYGHTSMTDGVYDLYWIAVDPRAQRGGVGRALLRATEADVRRRGGRMIIIETAGKAEYDQTRAFYARTDCVEIARIRDFYRVGDDKVVYQRKLD
jgi:ribosomal protein S18 acetylase RimI-like enzyme